MDAACLADCIIEAQQQARDVGSLRVLRRYERWRKADNTLMILAMRGFKELFSTTSPSLVKARQIGLRFTNRLDFLKNYFMRMAMGEITDFAFVSKKNYKKLKKKLICYFFD